MTQQTLQDVPRDDKTREWFLSKCLNTQYRLIEKLFFKAMRLNINKAHAAMESHATPWSQYEALCELVESEARNEH